MKGKHGAIAARRDELAALVARAELAERSEAAARRDAEDARNAAIQERDRLSAEIRALRAHVEQGTSEQLRAAEEQVAALVLERDTLRVEAIDLQEILRRFQRRSARALAGTDHASIKSNPQAMALAAKREIDRVFDGYENDIDEQNRRDLTSRQARDG